MTFALRHSFGEPRPDLLPSPVEVANVCAVGGAVVGVGGVGLWRFARVTPAVGGAAVGLAVWGAGELVVGSSPDSRRRLMIQAPYRAAYFAAAGALIGALAARPT